MPILDPPACWQGLSLFLPPAPASRTPREASFLTLPGVTFVVLERSPRTRGLCTFSRAVGRKEGRCIDLDVRHLEDSLCFRSSSIPSHTRIKAADGYTAIPSEFPPGKGTKYQRYSLPIFSATARVLSIAKRCVIRDISKFNTFVDVSLSLLGKVGKEAFPPPRRGFQISEERLAVQHVQVALAEFACSSLGSKGVEGYKWSRNRSELP